MEQTNRNRLDHQIYSYIVNQLKKEFKNDIVLVADRLDELIREHTFKDVRFLVRQEIRKIKNSGGNG